MTSAATRRRIEGNRPARPVTEKPIEERSTADLLTAAYALTHEMDRLTARFPREQAAPFIADARVKRDLITAEVLRRAGA